MGFDSMQQKSLTFITRQAPYGSNKAKLAMDAALASAVFEQKINFLFMDDGVFQLIQNQNAEFILSKTTGRALETLELYGIEKVLVDAVRLEERDLSAEDLAIPVKILKEEQVRQVAAHSDVVINL